ncbi:YafY family protein [Phenylobacterium sp.]|uniref:helix-turn-helix transcriptional regulator n=1 Tax=Phenylobacterium sp. TaxID=1871053 RepID=UPI0025D831E9|nr:transcriptional regulator [Phenylobacterium sp.]
MRASRLLSILLLLQTRGRMTAQALADEFETSVRTIYRDIDHLSAAGVPVYADRGRTGGFQLLEGYRTRLTGLSAAEAETLFLSGLPGPAADLGLGDAMAAAQLKLLAALPAEGRRGAARVGSRFHLDPIGWYRNAEQTDVLPSLADAVWNTRRIRVRYESWRGVVDRDLEPLGLTLKAGVWYLVAQAGGRPRTYRVSNIRGLELLPDTFQRPEAFDLAGFWRNWVKDFEDRLYTSEATLRLSPTGLRQVCNVSPLAERAARAAQDFDADGWATVTIPIESIEHAASDFLKLGTEAEVLAPPELRDRMADVAQELANLYATQKS